MKPKNSKIKRPRILVLDIETAPILAWVWQLWDQNVGLNQIERDWHILSWSAKWLDENKIFFADQSKAKKVEDDRKMLKQIWNLLDEADIIITQNGIRFDKKKLFARFILNKMGKPSPFKHIDTFKIAKENFAFTSNKLEYMADKLCKKHKKMTKRKFAGFELWSECLKGNKEAWREMKKYNIQDILTLEELYHVLAPWSNTINFNLYIDDSSTPTCNCGSTNLINRGYAYTTMGKFHQYRCKDCGKWSRGNTNLISAERRKEFKRNITE